MLDLVSQYNENKYPENIMVVYSIKDFENLSGIKAHTLRTWEKRYNILEPRRSATNIRYYTSEDLRHLLNVCILYRNGYKISKIAIMPQEEIKLQVAKHSKSDLNLEDHLDAVMLFILELDSYNFNKVLDLHIEQKGLESTMQEVIYPLLDKLNINWLTGSFQGVHESFVSHTIKSKITACIEKMGCCTGQSKHYIVYLPPCEKQELSLLYLHYLLKKNGCKVTNLGNDVNLSDILFATHNCKPDFVFTILNEDLGLPFQHYINNISGALTDGKLLVTGFQPMHNEMEWPDNVVVLEDISATLDFINNHN